MLHNIPTYYKGILYPSKTEASYAEFLDKEVKANRMKWWKRQIALPIVDMSGKSRKVIIDFLVFRDSIGIEETKNGLITDEFIEKSILFLEQYPGLAYDVLEPTATGWKRTPLADFIKPYLHTYQQEVKVYPKWQILLSKWFHLAACKLIP
jgi:hypothetical protein